MFNDGQGFLWSPQLELEFATEIPTVSEYGAEWLKRRSDLGRRSVFNDESRFRLYVEPPFGSLRVNAVTPRMISSWLAALAHHKIRRGKKQGRLSARTIHRIFAVLRGIMKSAAVDGLVTSSPCVHGRETLPPDRDADPERKDKAYLSPVALETLLTSGRVPLRRRALYALCGLAGLRCGEAAAVTWADIDRERGPLPALRVSKQFCTRTRAIVPTKTGVPRVVPVHPTLSQILAGLPRGTPDTPITQNENGRRWTTFAASAALERDCIALGFGKRTIHNLRMAYLSAARNGGAPREVIRLTTHATARDVDERYTETEYATICRAVLAIEVKYAA